MTRLRWVHGVATVIVARALAAVAIALAGFSVYGKGLSALRQGRLNINALMTVAVTGAFLIGQWPEAAMVMALPNFGNILDILSQRFSLAALRYSNALPIMRILLGKSKEFARKIQVGIQAIRPKFARYS